MLRLFFLISLATLAGHHHHEAHEHGAGTLKVAADNKQLKAVLEIPAQNMVGFEHKPKTTDQKNRVRAALALLKDGATIIALAAIPLFWSHGLVPRVEGRPAGRLMYFL